MPRGGARPGSGRKRKHPYPGMPHPEASQQGPVREAERKLREALPDLVDVAIKLAREGDKRMLVYCIDRVLGSPVQPIDVDVRRLADRLAAQTGADPDFLIRRAKQLADEHQATGS